MTTKGGSGSEAINYNNENQRSTISPMSSISARFAAFTSLPTTRPRSSRSFYDSERN